MQNKIVLLFLFLNACLCNAQNPWLQSKGKVLLSPSISHYYTDSGRDEYGNKSDFSENGFYENYVYKLYLAAPIVANKLSLVANVPYVKSTYQNDTYFSENNELGDVEVGVKMHLKKIGEYHYLMGGLNTVIPMYNNDKGPYVGFDKFGTELSVNISGNFEWMNVNKNYHQLEFGVKTFFANGPYQFKLYGSQAYRITNKFLVLGSATILLSRGDDFSVSGDESTIVNPDFIADFDIIKTTVNFGYEFSPKFAIYAGGFTDVWNRNISIGRGWQVFSVIKL
ncbi:hypothetical protein AXE80_10085 [Wenyingzhuangia fucanilytica]|uniref:Outer membrane protein beta-barrel domain-containing protein n=1 Tax=Wenyingzhuangia fucanilytica TaxID=1790137 RepID=A0A1B1Y762_9FLAO|nr:hypothetical protein [Wenyingzhuangia fucanilytica]ANW96603.1 hypothetical protein AXE80_10085 [Wenyingzhuangia fucanilytica]